MLPFLIPHWDPRSALDFHVCIKKDSSSINLFVLSCVLAKKKVEGTEPVSVV